MAKQLQLRKGTATEHDTFTGANGEVTVDTTNKTLRVHDGTTAGGTQLATLTGGLVPAAQLPLNNTLTSTSTTTALTAAQGKVLAERDFGVNQSWKDMTLYRALGTVYTNTTGRPITVNIILHARNDSSGVLVVVDGITIGYLSNSSQYGQAKTLSFIVPNDSTYKVILAFDGWVELR